jgi:hypothetical protein
MTGHPDADVLARFREDLLGRRRSARIRAHLARCEQCASVERELKEVSTLLASAPVPQMPDDLAARLDRVLAAEAAARAGTRAPDGASPERSPRPARSTRPARRWRTPALRAAAAAAAVVVIAGGGYGVSRLVSQGSSTTGAAPSAPRARPAPAQHAAAGSGSSAQGAQNGTSSRAPAGQPAGSVQVVHSGTDYVPGKLAAQAQALLADRSSRTPLKAASPAAALRGCVQQVTGGAQRLLVDVAGYQGHPATIIVQAPAGGTPGQVWVVAPGCSAASKDVLARAPLTGSG